MAAFLHGVSITETQIGPVPIQPVNSGIIGLVGSAPQWAVPQGSQPAPPGTNVMRMVASQYDASAFGPLVEGYSIPYALAAIQEQGAGEVIVVDVFSPSVHQTAVSAQTVTMPASGPQVVSLGHMGIIGPGLNVTPALATSVVVKNQAGTTTYVENTDYVVDYVNGLITAKAGGAITAGESLSVSYAYCDPSKITDTTLVGGVSAGVYSGIALFQLAYAQFGAWPRLLIAPSAPTAPTGVPIQSAGSQDAAVATALDAMAQKIRALAWVDCPAGTNAATAIANRGAAGNTFNTSSKRTVLCAPRWQFTDLGINPLGVTVSAAGLPTLSYSNAPQVSPYSPWAVGACAARDLSRGYWWSPSNRQIAGLLGPDVPLYASISDPGSDTNQLNAQGIFTGFIGYGTGVRTWGNTSAAFPTLTTPDTFIPVRRTMDMVEQAAQLAMMAYLDRPLTNATIDIIVEAVNSFLRNLVGLGALIDGVCSYDPANNPVSQLAAGTVVFSVSLMPPPPAQTIEFAFYLNTAYLAELTGATQSGGATGLSAT